MRYWIIAVLALVFFAVCVRSVRGATPPGTPILLTAEVTWDGGSSRAECVVVVANPLFAGRTFCAQGAVKHYKVAGEWFAWHDPALAGCEVLIPVTGTPYPVRGVVTNDGRVWVGGELME